MDPNQKAWFDSLEALNQQSWQEFLEKTRLEWRVNFVLWAAIGAAVVGILSGDISVTTDPAKIVFLVVGFVLLGIHLWFLYWVHAKVRRCREYLYTIRDVMWNQAQLEKPPKSEIERTPETRIWRRPTFVIQLLVTTILLTLLFFAIFGGVAD